MARLFEFRTPNCPVFKSPLIFFIITPLYGVKEFVCLSLRLLQTLTQIISGLAKPNGLNNVLGHLWQKPMSQKIYLAEKCPIGPGLRAETATFLTQYFFALFTMCASSKNCEMGLFRQCF